MEGHGLTSSAFRSAASRWTRGTEGLISPLWFSAVGTRQASSQRVGTQTSCHWNSCSIAPTRSGFWSHARDPRMVQPRSASRQRTQDQNVSSHAFVFTCGLDSQMRRLERMESELLTSSSTRLQQRAEPLGSPVSGVLVSFGPNLFCATDSTTHTAGEADSRASFFFTFRLDDQNCHHSDY